MASVLAKLSALEAPRQNDVLALLERPIDRLVCIDFETFYDQDYSLSKLSTSDYVRDPRFETIGVGVKGSGPAVWMSDAFFRKLAASVDWSRTAVLAHHAQFDGLILSEHYGIRPAFWVDTLSMARAIHGTEVGGSLAKLAVHYGAGEKGHEIVNAKGKHLADFTPEEWHRYGAYCKNDVELTHAIYLKMLSGGFPGGFPELELWLIDTTIRMFTEPDFRVDAEMLIEYLAEEQDRKKALLERVAKDRSVLLSNDKFAALLMEMGITPPQKVSAAKSKKAGKPVLTWALSKTDPGMKALLEHERDEVRRLAEARVGVKSTINETRTERFLKLGAGGKAAPVYLLFHGAHTGRWSGGDKTNFQNLERTNKKDPRKGRLRKALMAPPGHVLVAMDSSQIEARKLAWLAGHRALVEAFRQGRDVYSEFASVAYGRHVDRKKNPDDEIPGFVGKTSVLGLGYALGWLKFGLTLLQGAMGGPPVQFTKAEADALGVDMDAFLAPWGAPDEERMAKLEVLPLRLSREERVFHFAVAHHIVQTYRRENSLIAKFWKRCDGFIEAIAAGEELQYGPLHIGPWGIRRPSGLTIRYPGLRKSVDEEGRERGWSYFNGRERVHLYGGKATENIVQALARDVIAEQMLRVRAHIEPFGGKILSTTHDEIVACVPEAKGQETLAFMLETMKTAPSWAAGLPLNAEGGIAVRYGDAK